MQMRLQWFFSAVMLNSKLDYLKALRAAKQQCAMTDNSKKRYELEA